MSVGESEFPSACLVREPGCLDYPRGLSALSPAPVIYVRGDAQALSRPMVAVVGTRTPRAFWRAWAAGFAASMAKNGFAVCSGFAPGIDRAAHRGALCAEGKTVAVLGEDVFQIRARGETQGLEALVEATVGRGCFISEHPPGLPRASRKETVLRLVLRNRLIAALSAGVVVAAAWYKGGALITSRWAEQLGKPVWVADFGEYTPPGNLRQILAGHTPLPSEPALAAQVVSLFLSSS